MPEQAIHRVGIGTDIHRLVEGGPLRLGGLDIPFSHHLHGHSDADVVLHALTDALLGAAGLPDIGELFPDTDPKHKGADSRRLLSEALAKVLAAGYRPLQVDLVIHAERPKLSTLKPQIRTSIAGLLSLPEQNVSIKAKTNEGMDAVGRGEAIACTCVVGLTAKND
jgi:2-C-methyl-D-erythritol 2,4-cyclodiphosphate synthase